MRFISRLLVMSIAFTSLALAQSRPAESLAATPPMGWNSWNWFAGKVTDKDIRQAADLIISSGMRDAGYVYVNIDDTWKGIRFHAVHPSTAWLYHSEPLKVVRFDSYKSNYSFTD